MDEEREMNAISERAFEWLSDLQDGDADSTGLFRWLAESPRHVEEFSYALTLSDEITGLTQEQCAQITALNAAQRTQETVVPLPRLRINRNSIHPVDQQPIYRLRLWSAAAAIASIAIGFSLWAWDFGWTTYTTEFGEQRMVDLQDGSTVHLNTQSRVKVRYRDHARDIRLLSGEALFKVQQDPLRPFQVEADESLIQAVGTEFNVYRQAERTLVAVLEGSVRVAGARSLESLGEGQEARIPKTGNITTRTLAIDQIATWRERRLLFLNDSLADIATEFNRYNRHPQVVVEDEHAARKRFAAIFDADAPEALVQVLKTHQDLTVETKGGVIRVRSR
jgi:transmembrane sensor